MEDGFRYERKFVLENMSFKAAELYIKSHPALFKEIYKKRYVCSIYFDTSKLECLYDNIDGNFKRAKCRIRWYGDLYGIIKDPILEIKYKQGPVGKKIRYQLNRFVWNKDAQISKITSVIQNAALPKELLITLLKLKPLIIVRYNRKYLLSGDKRFRITIDRKINFFQMGRPNHSSKASETILELKYESQYDDIADHISNEFPFPLSKYSKYVNGMMHLFDLDF